MKNVKKISQNVNTDLGEDASSGGDSAVHHTVENGEQAVKWEGLWSQKVVTCLETRQFIDFI